MVKGVVLHAPINVFFRRKLIRSELKPLEAPITLTSFPRLGVPGPFTDPYHDPKNAQASHSLFLPDEITNPHVRFPYVFYTLMPLRNPSKLTKLSLSAPSLLIFAAEEVPRLLSTSLYSRIPTHLAPSSTPQSLTIEMYFQKTQVSAPFLLIPAHTELYYFHRRG